MEFFHYLLLITFLLSLLKLVLTITTSKPKPKLPPGPPNLPLIGGVHHLVGGVPHHTLANLSKIHGPLMHLKLGQVHTIVASSPDAARAINHTHDTIFATRAPLLCPSIMSYGGKDLAYAPYGHYWRQLRKLCVLELLSAKRVKSFRAIREQELSSFIQSVYATAALKTAINLSKGIMAMTNDITARAAVGSKCGAQRTFMLATQKAMETAAGFNLADLFPAASGVLGVVTGMRFRMEWWHRKADKIMEEIIREGKEKRRSRSRTGDGGEGDEDLLDVLLRLQEQGGLGIELTDDCIKGVITDVLAGGSETSSRVVEWAMSELMKNPELMKKAQKEVRQVFKGRVKVSEDDIGKLNYLEMVIKETLRLHPPLPLLIPRQCTGKCDIDDYEIPENSRVLVNVWAIGRDPRYWDEPEEFRPERFAESALDFKGNNFEYLPFGVGRRMCPGITFGLINVMMPLAHLLYYFDWRISNGGGLVDDLDMTEALGITARRKNDLCLYAMPHISCSEGQDDSL